VTVRTAFGVKFVLIAVEFAAVEFQSLTSRPGLRSGSSADLVREGMTEREGRVLESDDVTFAIGEIQWVAVIDVNEIEKGGFVTRFREIAADCAIA
jgi:hypothetical protein